MFSRAPGDLATDASERFTTVRFPGYALGLLRLFPFVAWSLGAFLRHHPHLVLPMNIGYGGPLSLLLSLTTRCRYVCLAYAYEFLKFRRRPLLRWLYNTIYRRSMFTIAISKYTRSQLIDFGVSADKIRVAHPGVALEKKVAGPAAGSCVTGSVPISPCVIGTCGRLIHRKGIDLVISALPEIRGRVAGIRYLVAGDGPLRNELEELAARLGVRNHVEFMGALPEGEKAEFYGLLDVYVMPSRADMTTGHVEGFGLVFLEAAWHGVPSVATTTGGIPEAIDDGVSGRLVPPESPQALARIIVELLHCSDKLKAMGAAARQRAVSDFDWDDKADVVEEWLTEAVTKRGSI